MVQIISYGSSPEQFGELREPPGHGTRPLVMLIHGGFWRDQYRLDLMHPLTAALNDRGYATWNIEYRRVGPTGGGYPATLQDVASAIDHFADGAWSQTVVIGHSAGGHLALWNASRQDARRRPDLTIGLAPVADVITANLEGVGVDATTNFFGGAVHEVPDHYAHGQPDPLGFAGRVVVLHGDRDDSVPVSQARALEPLIDRVEILEGVGHFEVIDPDHASWQIVFDEIDGLRGLGLARPRFPGR